MYLFCDRALLEFFTVAIVNNMEITQIIHTIKLSANPQDTQEAKCLADQVEMYYCNPSSEKLDLLMSFTEKPSEFKHMDLVAQLESISLVQPKKD